MNTSINKIWKLLLRELRVNAKTWIILISLLVGLTLMSFIIDLSTGNFDTESFFKTWYLIGLITGNIIITTIAFKDLRTKGLDLIYISIPASTTQKWLAIWLLTFIGYFVFFTAIFYLLTFGIYLVLLGNGITTTMPQFLTPDTTRTIKNIYPLINAILLLGTLKFKNHVLLYTAAISTGIFIMIYIVLILFTWFYIKYKLGGIKPIVENIPNIIANFSSFEYSNNPMKNYILILLLWTASFFSLKEKQLK